MLNAKQQNLLIWQGDDFSLTLDLSIEFADLAGHQLRAQIRDGWESGADLLAVLAVTPLTGGIVRINLLKALAGAMAATCTPAEIPKKDIASFSAAKLPEGAVVWDLQVTDLIGVTTTVRWGYVLVVREVTIESSTPSPPPVVDPANPYPQYITEAEGDLRYAPIGGGSGGVPLPSLPAAATLSALRLVSNVAGQYDYSDPVLADSVWAIAGLTNQSINQDQYFSPIRNQPVTDASWNWAAGKPVFLGTNGGLTQVAPSSGYLVVVAKVLSPQTLFIQIEEPTKL